MNYSHILTINANKTDHMYVVGDLHGSYSLLMQELKILNFDFQNDLLICTRLALALRETGVRLIKPWV